MKIVWTSRPGAHLLICGEGPEAALIPAGERIEKFVEYVPEEDLEEIFRRASLFVLPYIQASQSGIGLRALAHGIPVVVTEVGSLPDLAISQSFVVPPKDPEALARALLEHLDHTDSTRRQALLHARREFAWPVVAAQSVELYDRVVGRALA
jgi:glycosyltransferase involved in cell wall biosynthesis